MAGGIGRTGLNWASELLWRAVGVPDLVASLAGLRLRKKMFFALMIPSPGGRAITTEAAMTTAIAAARWTFDLRCDIDLVYTGPCTPRMNPPAGLNGVRCRARGFLADWWLTGSFIELNTAICRFHGGLRRLTGYGAELVVVLTAVDGSAGYSHGPTHNYVVIDPRQMDRNTLVHEIAHACGLILPEPGPLARPRQPHGPARRPPPRARLEPWQAAIIRNSRHCVLV